MFPTFFTRMIELCAGMSREKEYEGNGSFLLLSIFCGSKKRGKYLIIFFVYSYIRIDMLEN